MKRTTVLLSMLLVLLNTGVLIAQPVKQLNATY